MDDVSRDSDAAPPERSPRSFKFRKAKMRHLLLTVGADRLTGGWLGRRHRDEHPVTRLLTITTPAWPASLDGLRIGHVSDFHFGDLMTLDKARRSVDALRKEAPDLICNTGDLVDLEWNGVEPLVRAFAELDPPLGNFLVLGNHDELDSADDVARVATEAGLHVLRDACHRISRPGGDLLIAGVDWGRTPPQLAARIDAAIDGCQPHILLCHNPKGFDHAAARQVPLTLAGHTHGGQIARRDKPDANMAFAHRRSAGLYESGDFRLFVTVGVGAWFPLRMNCPAEVVIITMRHGPSDATLT